jgi:hypothetical protein
MFKILKCFLVEVGETSDLCRNMIAIYRTDRWDNVVLADGYWLSNKKDVPNEAMSPDTYKQSWGLFPHQQKQCLLQILKVSFNFILKLM